MDQTYSLRLLQTLIDYFEAGNQQTDAVAKAILENDFEYKTKWEDEIKRFRNSTDWTGLRSPEAEILAAALRFLLQLLENPGSPRDYSVPK